jgi:hypothetical protein
MRFRAFSRFPCTADEYFAMMVDGPFQQKLHVEVLDTL